MLAVFINKNVKIDYRLFWLFLALEGIYYILKGIQTITAQVLVFGFLT